MQDGGIVKVRIMQDIKQPDKLLFIYPFNQSRSNIAMWHLLPQFSS